MPVGAVGVFSVEPVALDQKFCHIAAGKIAVCQAVGADLPQDAVSGADAFSGIQLVHHVRMIGDVYICFVAPVENAPVVTADLTAGRHLNDQQRAAKKNTHVLSVWIGIKCKY